MLIDMANSASQEAKAALARGMTLSLVANAETQAEWDAVRRAHQPWGSRAKRGRADGTLRTLDVCRGFTLACVRCGSLVHWMAARCRASKAGRIDFIAGDGCSSRGCSINHRPAQFTSSQRSMAAGLEAGTRLLINWPKGRDALQVQVQASEAALDAAARARIAQMCAVKAQRRRGRSRKPKSRVRSEL